MLFVTDVLIGGSFADWFAYYSLDKNYNCDPNFGPKISPNHVSCDTKIFIGPRGFLSDRSGGPTNFREHWELRSQGTHCLYTFIESEVRK